MKPTKLIVLEEKLIPPFSEVFIMTKPERELENLANLVEPNEELASEGLLVGRSVVGKTGLIPVRVANVTGEPKNIRAG